ncbi:hypothetical protein H7142_00580 [Candidatus Saccharibacteria bacterium]|nr:hypothetical protein [Candidatus Saccharibacteria bacterium]
MADNHEIIELAEQTDEPIRSQLFEYARLRENLARLTGIENPREDFIGDILSIPDMDDRRLAARTAKRMRWLSRQTFPRL